MYRNAGRQSYEQTIVNTNKHTHLRTDIHTYIHADIHTYKTYAYRQTYKYTGVHT